MKRRATTIPRTRGEDTSDPLRSGSAESSDDVLSVDSLVLAFERAPVGLAIAYGDGIVLRANPAFAAMLGYSVEEMQGKTIADMNHPEDLAASRANVERMLRGESDAYEMTKRYVQKDGRFIWVRLHVSWLRDRDDGRFLLQLTDITAEKVSQDALAASERRFRQMAEAIDQAFWIYSVDPFRLLYSSPTGERIFGFDPMDHAGDTSKAHQQRMLAAVHPEDLPIFLELMSGVLTAPREHEYRVLRTDGEIRWVRTRAFPIRDGSGNSYRIAGVTEDITARKEADRQVERFHQLKQLITNFSAHFVNLSVERIDDAFGAALTALSEVASADLAAIWLFDESRTTLTLNWYRPRSQLSAPLDRALDSIRTVKRTLVDLRPTCYALAELPEAFADARSALAAAGLRSFIEVPLVSGGTLLGVLGFASTEDRTWSLEMCSLLGIAAGMFANVIERIRAEEATRSHRDQLAHVLRLKTMGQLASGIAHELNQPLSAILSYARGCARRIEGGNAEMEEIRGALERIGEQAVRAADVIRMLRALVKAESNRTRQDINDLLKESLRLVHSDLALAGVEVTLESRTLPRVQVDAIQIEQVILNLVRNACDALANLDSERKRIDITAALRGSKTVEVSIRDRGPGIEAALSERIFDDFFTSRSDGLGLGLPISRSIIETHGGHLWLDTNVTPGACFRFTLPLSSAE